MKEFFTYDMLKDYATLGAAVFTVTQFIKDIPLIKKIPTKYISFLVAFVFVLFMKVAFGEFQLIKILPNALTALVISMATNGVYDFDKKKKELIDSAASSGIDNNESVKTVNDEYMILDRGEQ